MLKLYHYGDSLCSMKTRLCLFETESNTSGYIQSSCTIMPVFFWFSPDVKKNTPKKTKKSPPPIDELSDMMLPNLLFFIFPKKQKNKN